MTEEIGPIAVVGLDLAWGENNCDGVCVTRYHPRSRRAEIVGYVYPQGDDELLSALSVHVGSTQSALLAIDAPIVCPNRTGTRPVDRLTHRLFHREHAACHPANLNKCPRPARILKKLSRHGFAAGWELPATLIQPNVGPDLGQAGATSNASNAQPARPRSSPTKPLTTAHFRLAAEVYPHPAMVRLFKLPRIVKYKKGLVAERRREFRRLQKLLRALIAAEFSFLVIDATTEQLLRLPWTKPVEDHLDAFFCALIGLWHVHHRGRRSEVIGDLRTGFILLPEDLR